MTRRRCRIVRNRHGSAQAACEAWRAGSLWGDPIVLGPGSIHVYGAWRRRWKPVAVEFRARQIVIVRTP